VINAEGVTVHGTGITDGEGNGGVRQNWRIVFTVSVVCPPTATDAKLG